MAFIQHADFAGIRSICGLDNLALSSSLRAALYWFVGIHLAPLQAQRSVSCGDTAYYQKLITGPRTATLDLQVRHGRTE